MIKVEIENAEPKWIEAAQVPSSFFVADRVEWTDSFGDIQHYESINHLFSRRGNVITTYTNGSDILGHYLVDDDFHTKFLNVRQPKGIQIKVNL
jgi:hypothetical protein